MVENGKIQRFGSASELARSVAVGCAGPSITARMIVRQHQASAADPCGFDDDVPNRHADRFRLAFVTFDMETARGMIDMGNPQALMGSFVGLKAGGEEPACGLVAVEERRGLGTLKPHVR